MTMAQGDYLPGTYSRVGTKENPGTYLGGGSGGTSQTMPPKVKKVWVLDNDRWEHAQLLDFRREVQYSGSMGTYQRSLGQLRQMDERRSLENGTTHFLYRQYLA